MTTIFTAFFFIQARHESAENALATLKFILSENKSIDLFSEEGQTNFNDIFAKSLGIKVEKLCLYDTSGSLFIEKSFKDAVNLDCPATQKKKHNPLSII